MGRIRILEQSVAERIAAGEVVERPASVVKELIENSLDAASTQITVELAGAGLELIRVSDNGTGIEPEDLRLAVQRFATSKITTAYDLLEVRSFGFRGEALPSIAAVSHLEITSTASGTPEGRRLRSVGGEVTDEVAVGAPQGTDVVVRHLFFNTPARRKFLKSPSREFALIVETFTRSALAHPQVAFRLIHEGDEVLRYQGGREDDRVAAALGNEVYERSVACRETIGGVTVTGWLGRPELARATRRLQHLFVNRRAVHSRLLASAVEQAYHQLLPVGRFPVFVVLVDLAPRRVDVNVHPRKLEVRFDDDHQVFGAVARAARSALRTVSLGRTIQDPAIPSGTATGILDLPTAAVSISLAPPAEVAATGRLPAMRLLGQLHATYLLAQGEEGLIVIDQHAAHERVLYERLLRMRLRGAADGQLLVAPVPVSLGPGELAVLVDHQALLTQLGFDLEPFGDRTVLLRAVPRIASSSSPERLLRDLLTELVEGERATAAQTLLERLTIATACHTAIKAGDILSGEQMAALLRDLAETDDPFTCFHGRPTLITLPLGQLERWFLRK